MEEGKKGKREKRKMEKRKKGKGKKRKGEEGKKELYTLLKLSFKLWLVFSYFLEFRNIKIDIFFG